MARVLHLLSGARVERAAAVIARQRREADTDVVVVALPGASRIPAPDGVTVRRVDADLSYDQLLDLVFASDRVVTW